MAHYTQPAHQRYIIRILFMVPVYAVCSWISLLDRNAGIYLDTVRDCYESWVIYNFLALCLAYVGGAGNVANRADGREMLPSWGHGTCCLPPLAVDGGYVKACKRGALQFVIIKPILAALTLTLVWANVYGDQEFKPNVAYPYVAFIYNVSYTVALYALLLFYLGARDLLEPFQPLLKFVLVKSVIFLTFWQSIMCAVLVSNGDLPSGEDGRALQNVLICCEMIVASLMMLRAFPASVYVADGGMGALGVFRGAAHALSVGDVVNDTVHQFAPTYQEYVLHGSEGGAPRKIKMKTHVMMGREMLDNRIKNKGGRGPGGAKAGGVAGAESLGRKRSTKRSSSDERQGSGMLANAGFENSYDQRYVEDDLEDDFGETAEWDSGDEESGNRGGVDITPGKRRTSRVSGGGGLSPIAVGGGMPPLGAERRHGAGTVFDAVVGGTAPAATSTTANSPLQAPFLAIERNDVGPRRTGSPGLPPPPRATGFSLAPPPGRSDDGLDNFASFKTAEKRRPGTNQDP